MAEFVDTTPDYASLLSLKDRHVIVLGGGLGIGRQTSMGAAALGAKVSVVDFDPERAAKVAAEVDGLALTADVTNRADMERVFSQAVDRFGPLHGLADIVGVSDFGPLMNADDDLYRRNIDLNLTQAFLALQVGVPLMAPGGSIAFVASLSGMLSAPKHAIYGAAKAGLSSLVGSAAVELGPNVRINAVAPGQTATPRVAQRHPEPDYYENAGKIVPLRRVGQPSDIASALLFFLSDLSSWITGQTLLVDGGTSRNYPYPV